MGARWLSPLHEHTRDRKRTEESFKKKRQKKSRIKQPWLLKKNEGLPSHPTPTHTQNTCKRK